MHQERPRGPSRNSSRSGRSSLRNNTETKSSLPAPAAEQKPQESQPPTGHDRADSMADSSPIPIIVEPPKPAEELPEQKENWRHGDIKPENIMRFHMDSKELGSGDAPSTPLGHLKLADLGRAKQRFKNTQEMTKREYDQWRTKPYDSPDDYIGRHKTSMSRLYDIWSLGCVCFEMLIWLLYGTESHKSFSQSAIEDTSGPRRVGTPYWTKRGDSARVDGLVTLWMDQIQLDPACKKEHTVLGDLLDLIRERLLIVDLPSPAIIDTTKCRTNAADLVKRFDEIIENAKGNPSYLYSNPERTGKSPPQRMVTVIDPAEKAGVAAGNRGLSVRPAENAPMTTRSMGRYTHDLSEKWDYVQGNAFASETLGLLEDQLLELFEASSAYCQPCKTLDLDDRDLKIKRAWGDLQSKNAKCGSCALFSDAAGRSAPPGEQISPLQEFTFQRATGVRVSSLLMGQPIVAQALLVLSLLSSQTLLPS
jgi:serine/threonine protein kinase